MVGAALITHGRGRRRARTAAPGVYTDLSFTRCEERGVSTCRRIASIGASWRSPGPRQRLRVKPRAWEEPRTVAGWARRERAGAARREVCRAFGDRSSQWERGASHVARRGRPPHWESAGARITVAGGSGGPARAGRHGRRRRGVGPASRGRRRNGSKNGRRALPRARRPRPSPRKCARRWQVPRRRQSAVRAGLVSRDMTFDYAGMQRGLGHASGGMARRRRRGAMRRRARSSGEIEQAGATSAGGPVFVEASTEPSRSRRGPPASRLRDPPTPGGGRKGLGRIRGGRRGWWGRGAGEGAGARGAGGGGVQAGRGVRPTVAAARRFGEVGSSGGRTRCARRLLSSRKPTRARAASSGVRRPQQPAVSGGGCEGRAPARRRPAVASVGARSSQLES